MDSIKENRFIDKLVNDTINNKYYWRRIDDLEENVLESKLPSQKENELVQFDSFWIRTNSQYVFLLSFGHNHAVLVSDKYDANKYSFFDISSANYYRLQTLILDSLDIKDQLLDDFLND